MIDLRPAVPGDELAVAAVHVRSWQEGYRGLLPQDRLDAMQPAERAARYTFGADPTLPKTVVATDAGVIVGFVSTRSAAPASPGEVLALYLEPARWGQGIGQRLMADARARLSAAGHREATLWLLAGNVRGARFYATDGWRHDGEVRDDQLWGLPVRKLRYRRALP